MGLNNSHTNGHGTHSNGTLSKSNKSNKRNLRNSISDVALVFLSQVLILAGLLLSCAIVAFVSMVGVCRVMYNCGRRIWLGIHELSQGLPNNPPPTMRKYRYREVDKAKTN